MRRIAAALISFTFLIMSGTASAEPFEGVYAGIEGGWASLDNINALGTSNTGVVGGYIGLRGKVARKFILGIEGNADFITNGSDKSYSGSGTLGYLFTPDRLVYLRAGYARFDGTANLNGWLVGVGYEVAVWENINFRLDYRYSNYEDTKLAGPPPTSISNTSHQALAGFSLDF